MSNPFVAEIRIFGFNFNPRGWAFCQGQILPISQNTALFSLLGTNYGGNGTSNFGLPDFRSRVPVSQGSGPGLTSYFVGQTGGTENVSLTTNALPAHNHTAGCQTATGNAYSGHNAVPAPDAGGNNVYSSPSNGMMNSQELTQTGGTTPHNNLQPFLGVNYCIALQGVFPPRS
jgi:microcystin-dependent protein